ncbi:MAG: flippase [Candidatus Margulisiibacteriota bacterium]|nr:flippase [Candidatus Margulisiibacteriota bacterium]
MEKSNTTKKIAKNFSWLLLGNIVGGTINFILVVYVARTLGAVVFGLLQFALAFIAYLYMVVDSGLSIFGTRGIAKDPSQVGDYSLNIILMRLTLALFVFFAALLVVWLIPIAFNVRLLFIAVFSLVFYHALRPDWIFQGLEKMQYIAFARILYPVISFLLIVFLVKQAGDLVRVPLIQSACGLIVATLFLIILFKKYVHVKLTDVNVSSWPKYFIQAFPLGASAFLTIIYGNMDMIMLGFMDQPAVVGYYNAAYRIFYILGGIFGLWVATAIPTMSKRIGEDKDGSKMFLDKFTHITLLGIIPITVLIYLASPLVIGFVFGPEYTSAVFGLQVLIWAIIPIAIGSIYGQLILISAGFFKRFFQAVVLGVGANIILNFILIPRFSFIGAAIATILAELIVTIMVMKYSQKVLPIKIGHHFIKPLIIVLAALIGFYVVYFPTAFMSEYPRIFIACGFAFLLCLLSVQLIDGKFLSGFIKELIVKRER